MQRGIVRNIRRGKGAQERQYKVKEGNRGVRRRKCHLIYFLSFHEILGNPPSVVCIDELSTVGVHQ